jgi:predicted Fe-Mo cluster-binding NifX family protein
LWRRGRINASEVKMKIAVTSTGKTLESAIDPRFGRAPYILIIETDDGKLLEAIDNAENSGAFRGAGIQAAKAVADRKVGVLLTGHCGPNAFSALEAAGVKVGTEQKGTALDAIERFKKNEIVFAEKPNAEAHW